MAALLVCRLPLEASIRYVECCLRDKVRERDDNVFFDVVIVEGLVLNKILSTSKVLHK